MAKTFETPKAPATSCRKRCGCAVLYSIACDEHFSSLVSKSSIRRRLNTWKC